MGADSSDQRSSPFVGLDPFTTQDQLYFFGRRGESIALAANFLASKICVAFGRSGVGKSSIVLAGLPRAFEEFEDVNFLPLRDWQDNPYQYFQDSLKDLCVKAAPDALSKKELEEIAPHILAAKIAEITGHPLMIVCDQFEEFFRGSNQQSRDMFEAALSRIVSDTRSDVHVSLVMRDDGLFHLEKMQTHIPEVLTNTISIQGLSRTDAAEAIRGPVEQFNKLHGTRYKVTDDFVERLLNQVSASKISRNKKTGSQASESATIPDDEEIEAPFLQLSLQKLWQVMIDRHYDGLTGDLLKRMQPSQIVEEHFSAVIDRWKSRHNELAIILDRMVTSGGHKIAYSLPDLEQFIREEKKSGLVTSMSWRRTDGFLLPLLNDLTDGAQRIFRQKSSKQYELFHDVLAGPVNRWLMQRRERNRAKKRNRVRLYSLSALVMVVIWTFAQFARIHELDLDIIEKAASAAKSDLQEGRLQKGFAKSLATLNLLNESDRDFSTVEHAAVRNELTVSLSKIADRLDRSSVLTYDKSAQCEKTSTGEHFSSGPGRAHDRWVYSVDFSANSKSLISGASAGIARVWKKGEKGWSCVCELNDHRKDQIANGTRSSNIRSVAFNPAPGSEHLAVSSSWDRTARIWDTVQCKQVQILRQPQSPASHPFTLYDAAFSADGQRVATGAYDGSVKIWERSGTGKSYNFKADLPSKPQDANSNSVRNTLHGHSGTALSVAFHPTNSDIIATGGRDSTARLWTITDNGLDGTVAEPYAVLSKHQAEVKTVSFDIEGNLITASFDETVRIWDTATGSMIKGPLIAHTGDIWDAQIADIQLANNNSSNVLVTGSWDKTAKIWDSHSFRLLSVLGDQNDAVRDLAVAPDGSAIAVATRDGQIHMWNATDILGLTQYTPTDSNHNKVALNPVDDSEFAVGDNQANLRVWNRAEKCARLAFPVGWNEAGKPTELSGETSDRRSCRLRPVNRDRACVTPGNITALKYSRDGSKILSGFLLGRLSVFDADSGEEIWTHIPAYQCAKDSEARDIPDGQAKFRVNGFFELPGGNGFLVATDKGIWSFSLDGKEMVPLPSDSPLLRSLDAETGANAAIQQSVSNAEIMFSGEASWPRVAISLFEPDNSNPLGIVVFDGSLKSRFEVALPSGYVRQQPSNLSISKDGNYLAATFGADLVVWLYSSTVDNYQVVRVLQDVHQSEIKTALMLNNHGLVATASLDEIIKLIDTNSGTVLRTFELQHQETIAELQLTESGEELFSAGEDFRVAGRRVILDRDHARNVICKYDSELELAEDQTAELTDTGSGWNLLHYVRQWYAPLFDKSSFSKQELCG